MFLRFLNYIKLKFCNSKGRTLKSLRRNKNAFPPKLTKHEGNPIIEPKQENNWEAWQTFNPGAVLINGKVHFLYRAIGQDGLSRLGYASSGDGFNIEERLSYPVYEHNVKKPHFQIFSYISGGSFGGAEDPRIVRVGDEDTLHMTYTACDNGIRVALTSIKIKDFLNKDWRWTSPVFISSPDEVHKNWVIFPEKINGKYAVLHSISPEILIDYFDDLDFGSDDFIDSHYSCDLKRDRWDGWIRGAGATPIKTDHGWLVFYHAMSADDFSKYKVGAMLLDLNDPTKVLKRSSGPVLEPDKDYENNGFKSGVVYLSGAVVKDGTLFVYYGGSDNYVCAAHTDLNDFLSNIDKKKKPNFVYKLIKKKNNN